MTGSWTARGSWSAWCRFAVLTAGPAEHCSGWRLSGAGSEPAGQADTVCMGCQAKEPNLAPQQDRSHSSREAVPHLHHGTAHLRQHIQHMKPFIIREEVLVKGQRIVQIACRLPAPLTHTWLSLLLVCCAVVILVSMSPSRPPPSRLPVNSGRILAVSSHMANATVCNTCKGISHDSWRHAGGGSKKHACWLVIAVHLLDCGN